MYILQSSSNCYLYNMMHVDGDNMYNYHWQTCNMFGCRYTKIYDRDTQYQTLLHVYLKELFSDKILKRFRRLIDTLSA